MAGNGTTHRKKIRWRLGKRKSKSRVWKTRWVTVRGGAPKSKS